MCSDDAAVDLRVGDGSTFAGLNETLGFAADFCEALATKGAAGSPTSGGDGNVTASWRTQP